MSVLRIKNSQGQWEDVAAIRGADGPTYKAGNNIKISPDNVIESEGINDVNYVHTDNNYTTGEKNKLQGIEEGAKVNIQSDWNSVGGDSYINNKPTLMRLFVPENEIFPRIDSDSNSVPPLGLCLYFVKVANICIKENLIPKVKDTKNQTYWYANFNFQDLSSLKPNTEYSFEWSSDLAAWSSRFPLYGDTIIGIHNLRVIFKVIFNGSEFVFDDTLPFARGNIKAARGGTFLTTNNQERYTPSKEYHPATKKYVDDITGDIKALATTDKNNLVAAINEVKASAGATLLGYKVQFKKINVPLYIGGGRTISSAADKVIIDAANDLIKNNVYTILIDDSTSSKNRIWFPTFTKEELIIDEAHNNNPNLNRQINFICNYGSGDLRDYRRVILGPQYIYSYAKPNIETKQWERVTSRPGQYNILPGEASYVLDTRNQEEYTPKDPYNPATKKYIDDIAGDKAILTTTAKDSLVAAINEINAKPSGGGSGSQDNTIVIDAGIVISSMGSQSMDRTYVEQVFSQFSYTDKENELIDYLLNKSANKAIIEGMMPSGQGETFVPYSGIIQGKMDVTTVTDSRHLYEPTVDKVIALIIPYSLGGQSADIQPVFQIDSKANSIRGFGLKPLV